MSRVAVCYNGVMATTNPATVKQLSFIAKLATERNSTGINLKPATTREASATIDALLAAPKIQTALPTQTVEEAGVYVLADGGIVKTKRNKADTAFYAYRWTAINGERLNIKDHDNHVKGDWVYEGGLVREIRPEMKMDLEQAKHFTLIYGQCPRCKAKLKAAKSVEAGIGPVCIKYFSWR